MAASTRKITQMPSAATFNGSEEQGLVQLSDSVTLTDDTISANATQQAFFDSGNRFLTLGFNIGQTIKSTGWTGGAAANNLNSLTITGLTANRLNFIGADGAAIVTATAGDTVTLARWVSVRSPVGALGFVAEDADHWDPVPTTSSEAINQLAARATIEQQNGGGGVRTHIYAGETVHVRDGHALLTVGSLTNEGTLIVDSEGLVFELQTDASGITFTPDVDADWTVPPDYVAEALDELAQRITDAEAGTGGITALTGDVTASGPGSAAATIANDAVTYAKMQNVSATSRVLGRKTAGSGDVEEVTLSELLDFVGSAAQGDILYRNASSWVRLAAGTSGQYLKTLGTGANPAWSGLDYNVGMFFTTTPSASEVLLLHTFAVAVVFPDDWSGSVGDIGTNPTSSFVLDVQKNGSSVGTITISTGGAFTFVTSGSTVSFAAGDQLKVLGPGTPDATAANVSITFLGARS